MIKFLNILSKRYNCWSLFNISLFIFCLSTAAFDIIVSLQTTNALNTRSSNLLPSELKSIQGKLVKTNDEINEHSLNIALNTLSLNKPISNTTKDLSTINQAIRDTKKHNLREETDGIFNKYKFKPNEQELNSVILNTNSFLHKSSNENCSLNNNLLLNNKILSEPTAPSDIIEKVNNINYNEQTKKILIDKYQNSPGTSLMNNKDVHNTSTLSFTKTQTNNPKEINFMSDNNKETSQSNSTLENTNSKKRKKNNPIYTEKTDTETSDQENQYIKPKSNIPGCNNRKFKRV